ncbi:unnamed protein product [Parascedosporium putredinis]|uniref:Uncharacterized protein n=1 Tax=Parascedosporium putredinis TaxID=1442378 RepID=A0A9P1H158_9PEZI|nr:unnamed protein product [Parascedosporium putredinis]CAI7993357.1 unnamed protein product [Parascedosporium putredinis]
MRLLLIIKLILHALAAVAALLSCIGFGVATTKFASWIIIFALLDIGLRWRSRKEDRPSDSGLTGCLIFLHIITIAAAIGGFALSLFIGFRYESGTERDDGTIRTTDQFNTVWIFIGRYSILTAG